VIGTRWPIRDEDAAALFDDFYRVLASGASISDALAQSKRAAIAAGRPAASWASLVLLGDGAFRPTIGVVPASPEASLRAPATTLLAGLFLVMTIAATVRRHRTTSRS
jgi:CHAT domain